MFATAIPSPHLPCGGHHVDTARKMRKAASRRPSRNTLISLSRSGADEGIRTLDLGKVAFHAKDEWALAAARTHDGKIEGLVSATGKLQRFLDS